MRVWPVLLVFLIAARANAQPRTDRLAAATSLFETAQDLVQRGEAATACPKFEESYRLVPANGTLINLADCHERIGKLASAWLAFREVAAKSQREGQSERAAVARERARALEPRLPKLRIELGKNGTLDGLEVERDGLAVTAEARGIAVPVDPGTHRVVVRATGYKPQTVSEAVTEEGATVTVAIPPLEPLVEPTPPPAVNNWQVPLGVTAFALGSATAVVGIVLGVAAKIEADDADCDTDNFCSPEGLLAREDALDLGNIGTGLAIAGAIVGAFGLTLWLTAPTKDEQIAVSVGRDVSVIVRY